VAIVPFPTLRSASCCLAAVGKGAKATGSGSCLHDVSHLGQLPAKPPTMPAAPMRRWSCSISCLTRAKRPS
jgi:hypothetical protein